MSLPAALHYYWMGGAASGGAPQADFDGLEFPLVGNPNQQSGALTFTLATDGTWTCPVPRFVGTESGNWFVPTTTDIGDNYEAMFSYSDGGNPNGSANNDAPTWTPLTSPLAFIVGLSGEFQDETWTVTCEIRDAGTHVVVASGTFLMSITLT